MNRISRILSNHQSSIFFPQAHSVQQSLTNNWSFSSLSPSYRLPLWWRWASSYFLHLGDKFRFRPLRRCHMRENVVDFINWSASSLLVWWNGRANHNPLGRRDKGKITRQADERKRRKAYRFSQCSTVRSGTRWKNEYPVPKRPPRVLQCEIHAWNDPRAPYLQQE